MSVVDKIEASIFSMNKPVDKPLGANRILIYGRPGRGKSTLAAGFPKAAIIDTEGSHKAFNVLRADAGSWERFVDAVTYVCANAPGKLDTVVVDSISHAYALCRKHVLEREGWASERDGGGYGAGYEAVRAEFRPVLTMLFDLYDNHGVGLVFVTHETTETVETATGDYTVVKPMLPDNGDRENTIGSTISRVFDCIFRYDTEGFEGEPLHILTTQQNGSFEAKDRTARMPKRVVVPELTQPNATDRAKAAYKVLSEAYSTK